jgi:hypothetical protein
VLEVRVMSPRIAWLGMLSFLGVLFKVACVVAVLIGIGWGVWRGVQHAFYQNPDFRLQIIDLNPNPVLDELSLADAIGINLMAGPSLFEIDVDEAADRLAKIDGVLTAHVERHLPGSLMVRVYARTPKAWISMQGEDTAGVRRVGGLLVDDSGVAYPCPERQFPTAAALPVMELPQTPHETIAMGEKVNHPSLKYGFMLLASAVTADPEAPQWIEVVRQINDWSLELVTRCGTRATFGLGDHARQMDSLRAALDHASEKGYEIETINLIPKYNIPITVRNGEVSRAILVKPKQARDPHAGQRTRDMSNLLDRN